MSDNTTQTAICPCDTLVHPQVIFNPPGRNVLAYRVGDYLAFRHALLLSRPGETELKNWRPGAKGDLALQMVEWWAYLADILTFYNQHSANQSYLRTADLDASVNRLIRILGYRPRPGIGAFGTVAALMSKPSPPFTLPQGFPIQSKSGPGKQPQIFEVSTATLVSPPDIVNVDVASPALFASARSVLLKGVITSIRANDELLLLDNQWKSSSNYAVVTVLSTQQQKDPRGNINTQVTFTSQSDLTKIPSDAVAANYQLMKSLLSAHVWQYAAPGIAFTNGSATVNPSTSPPVYVHLDAITRQARVGDPILFEDLSGTNTQSPQLADVTAYSEVIWYANPNSTSTPWNPPDPTTKIPPIPIPHTELTFTPELSGTWSESTTLIRYAWSDVGQLFESPIPKFSGTPTAVMAVPPATFPIPTNTQPLSVMLEDANGHGMSATGTIDNSSGQLNLTGLDASTTSPLTAPLRVLFDLLPVTRGKTVPQEILGSGDATIAGQEFVLQNSPLTYLLSSTSTSGGNYTSTLKIMVNNSEWKEMPSFYNQPRNAQVFVTREDENDMTHVQFGDGINGARLPSGVNNVVAQYRYGSGATAPDAGQLTVITQPWPNLKAIRNPVAVSGGADPDSSKQIRRYAPQSVLTFGRAVSAEDYETIASQAPGVTRARSYWAWDNQEQRTLVTIYVGDDANAVKAANVALTGTDDPNRTLLVRQAVAISVMLQLALRINPAYAPSVIISAVTTALLDDDTGLFGLHVLGIGQPIYQSQIYEACLSVPGVLAVHGLHFSRAVGMVFEEIFAPLYNPGEGSFFQLQAGNLSISQEV